MSQHSPSSSKVQPRLPCRGCMTTCANYATCDGKPWRVDKQPAVNPEALAELNHSSAIRQH